MADIPADCAARWTLDQLHALETHAIAADAPTPGAQSYTVVFWFQTARWTGYRVLINQGDNEGPGWSFRLDDNRLMFRVTSAAGMAEGSAALDPSPAWRHVAGVIDQTGQQLALYVDGERLASAAANWPDSAVDAPRAILIGGYTDPAGGHFDHTFGRGGSGWIDDVCLFSRALAPDEIRAFVRPVAVAPSAEFIIAAPLDEAPVTVRFDASRSRAAGEVRAWLWDFGDGTRGYGEQTEHPYAYAGDYRVRLTILDDRHAAGSADAMLHLTGQANPLQAVEVFGSGADGYACFRIPSIVRALNGDLIVFAEGRVETCSDSTATIRALCRRSADNGGTWSPIQVVARNLIGEHEHVVQNISPVVDRRSGRILVLYNKIEASEWDLAKGKGRSRIFCAHSDDHGTTWIGETDLTAALHRPDDWRVQRPTLGHALQLERAHPGRLVHAGLFTQGDHTVFESQNYVFWSDDGGETWTIGGIAPRVGLNEATAVELENGDLMLNSRAYRDGRSEGMRAVTVGHVEADGSMHFGETRLDSALVDPAVQASILRCTWREQAAFGGKNRILFSNPAHPQARVNLTVRLSYDEGRTWPIARTIDPGPSAYSDLVMQADGKIGVLYERGNQGGIAYVSFTLDWLTDGHDSLTQE